MVALCQIKVDTLSCLLKETASFWLEYSKFAHIFKLTIFSQKNETHFRQFQILSRETIFQRGYNDFLFIQYDKPGYQNEAYNVIYITAITIYR